jgi:hypothetical protein
MDNIQDLLKEATKDTLSEDNLKKIEEAIESKADELAKKKYSLKLEAALAKQDSEYAEKLETFLEEIDTDHTDKMRKLVEGIDQKHFGMLQDVISKYKKEYLTECQKFKDQMVSKVDKFFDIVVEEQIPKKELQEAVENTRSKMVLEQIAKIIGVDKIQQNKLVKEGLVDAKEQIDTLKEQIEKLEKDRKKLLTERVSAKRSELLSEKTKGLPRVKKQYIEKVLGNKSLEFINENFDYTLALFDEEEDSSREVLKEEATKKTKTISEKVDRVEKEVVKENKEQPKPKGTEMYLDGFGDTF